MGDSFRVVSGWMRVSLPARVLRFQVVAALGLERVEVPHEDVVALLVPHSALIQSKNSLAHCASSGDVVASVNAAPVQTMNFVLGNERIFSLSSAYCSL